MTKTKEKVKKSKKKEWKIIKYVKNKNIYHKMSKKQIKIKLKKYKKGV